MRRSLIIFCITLIFGIFVGWVVFHSSGKKETLHEHSENVENKRIWTCAMHPQIKAEEPGKCPICGMDLVPLVQNITVPGYSDAIHISKEAAELANVFTTIVTKQTPVKDIRLYGKVQADERLQQSQVVHVSGRIERLNVNYTGESVNKGQILAQIYSPDLIGAQQELLEAAKTKQSQPAIYEAAVEKLQQLKLTDNQISAIESSGLVQNTMNIVSNTNGIVASRMVNVGDYVSQGTVMFEIVDLSNVWVLFDAYESDLQFLKKGEKVSFDLQALPGRKYSGNIVFIDAVLDPITRVAKVRVESGNQSGELKPEMFATGVVNSTLDDYSGSLVIPGSAVLWTGKRSVVYVKIPDNEEYMFKMREVELGPEVGDSYIIMGGLNEGEEVVTRGTFSVDAAAQLEGKPSMMNSISVTGSLKNITVSENIKSETIKVSGNCEMCKERIESTTLSLAGVNKAIWNIETKQLLVDFDPSKTNLITIHKAVAAVGHDTELFKADDVTYNALPECCLYRK